jgi:MYXO-CTERM domain-containing protein
MWVRLRPFACAAALVALSLAPRDAAAFVREINTPPPPATSQQLYWSSSCETVNIYLNGFTQMTPDEVAKSIGAAAAAWGPDQVTCPTGTGDAGSGHPSFQIIPQFATGSAPTPWHDGNNTIVFQTDPNSTEFPPGALAYTQVWWQPNGNIIDADIQINAIPGPAGMPYLLANLDPGSPPEQHDQPRIDLQTLLTHEFGHFLGLAHTCESTADDNGDQPPDGSKDDQGQLIPTCLPYPDSSETVQAAAVMWYLVQAESPGTAKRVITTDDARGVCAIYPPARVAPACAQNAPDDGCACAASGEGSGSALAAALAGLALVAARRRRSAKI